jgi:hypothetical protein
MCGAEFTTKTQRSHKDTQREEFYPQISQKDADYKDGILGFLICVLLRNPRRAYAGFAASGETLKRITPVFVFFVALCVIFVPLW